MKKKIIITSTFVLAVLLTIYIFMVVIPENKYAVIREMKIENVNLDTFDDGIYKGEYAYGHYTYKVAVEVNDHKIIDIGVNHGRKSKQAKMAEGVVDLIIEQQKLNVDVVSGATTTSKAILKAVEIALKN